MKRHALFILLLLVAGAIVNVAVAWGCAIEPTPAGLATGIPFSQLALPHFSGRELPNAWDSEIWNPGPGMDSREAFCRDPLVYVLTVVAGWPARSLSGSLVNNLDRRGVIECPQWLLSSSGTTRAGNVLPLRPIWPGFAINTVFYAAVLAGGWLFFAAPFALRRRRRIKRGLCPRCAYPVGTNEVCTECGAAVTMSQAAKPQRGASTPAQGNALGIDRGTTPKP